MSIVNVEIPVAEDTAAALTDPRRRAAVGRLVDRMVRPRDGQDPLVLLLERISREAAAAGLTQQDIDEELAAWKAEKAARRG